MTELSLLPRNSGVDIHDLDSAHRVLRKWAQARLGKGDDFWNEDGMNGVARAAIDVIAVTHSLLWQLRTVADVNDRALERIEALETAAEKAEIGEEHF